jgi:hypothetical protein
MQLKPITAIIILSLVVASLLVSGCTTNTQPSSNQNAGPTTTYLSVESKDIALPLDSYSTVKAALSTGGKVAAGDIFVTKNASAYASPTGKGLGNKTVRWFVNGQAAGNDSTDNFGVAILSLNSLKSSFVLGKNYTVKAYFDGDSSYLPSNDTGILTTYMDESNYETTVYNQTVALVQSGSFPDLANTATFTGTYLTFDLSNTISSYMTSYLNSVPYIVYNPSSTVFFVKTTKLDYVGQYISETTGAPGANGYRAQFDIYVVKYPEKTAIGKHTIISEPVSVRARISTDQIGNSTEWQNWIKDHVTTYSGGSSSIPTVTPSAVVNVTTVAKQR